MTTRLTLILSLASTILSISAQCFAQGGGPAKLPNDEYKVVAFPESTQSATKRFNDVAAEGWEYVGPASVGYVVFRRSPVNAQRFHILGVWAATSDVESEKGQIEFTREGKVKLIEGELAPLAALSLEVTKENADQLEYELPSENRLAFFIGRNRNFTNVRISDDTLTITRAGRDGVSRTYKRVVAAAKEAEKVEAGR